MPSFRQLEVFRAVILEGSISGAARHLGIAQPTVTNTIRRLEDVLGTPLFDRSGTQVRPTTVARRIFESMAPTMSSLEHLSDIVLDVVRSARETFAMGVSPSVSQALAPRCLALLARRRPTMRLRMDTLSLRQNRDYLWLSEGDCAVTIFPVDDPGIASFHISSIAMVCVVPRDHRLARQDRVAIEDIAEEPLVFFHPNTPHGILVRRMFTDAGIAPNIAIETRFAETAPHLMREGFGIALQDELTGMGVRLPDLCVLPLAHSPRQPVLLHARADKAGDPDVLEALQCLREAARELRLPDEGEPGRDRP